jgi:hypothetical protein
MKTKQNIDVAHIEKELLTLRNSYQQNNVVSACLFNLIIYTQETHRIDYFQALVLRIIEKLPCRIIFIQGDSDPQKEYMLTNVSTETIGQGDLLISCDQVTIKVAGKYMARIPFTILPLLITDLPIYFLWGQDPQQESHILPYLEQFATSIIFDSESYSSQQQFSRDILEKMEHLKIDVIDMNWARIAGWREILSKAFNISERNQQLSQSKMIQINYQADLKETVSHQKTQAFYLQAWLAAVLDWEFISIQEMPNLITRITYKNKNKNPLVIDLCPKTVPDLSHGSILSFESITDLNQSFILSRKGTSHFINIAISSLETCDIPYTIILPSHQRGSSFVKELFFSTCSNHYSKMLKLIAQEGNYP